MRANDIADGQDTAHAPAEHTSPAGQTLPHVPQLSKSVWVLVQVPLQLVSPAWQESAHVPFEHTLPAGHAIPQAPQVESLNVGVAVSILLYELRRQQR